MYQLQLSEDHQNKITGNINSTHMELVYDADRHLYFAIWICQLDHSPYIENQSCRGRSEYV
jgi:hypothetical protein